jgi:DNA-binding CsgD family transcriptional regulator
MCVGLGVQWFARNHGLTLAETRVLEALSEGLLPSDIAVRFGVGISTIRSQIGSIRSKTRSGSMARWCARWRCCRRWWARCAAWPSPGPQPQAA